MSTRLQTLPLSISYSLTHPFLSSIIAHTPRPLSKSFSTAPLSLSSSIQLIWLSGRGRTSPSKHFYTLESSILSWAIQFSIKIRIEWKRLGYSLKKVSCKVMNLKLLLMNHLSGWRDESKIFRLTISWPQSSWYYIVNIYYCAAKSVCFDR